MRYHLDTSFLIDWRRSSPKIIGLRDEIAARLHVVSIDPIVHTEFFAAPRTDRTYDAVFESVIRLGTILPLTPQVSRLAATWLGPMDQPQRRARFADALVAAVAYLDNATLVTSDTAMPLFPVPVLLY